VRDVAVVGRPDPKWGESVQAAVVLRRGKTLDEAALIAWAKDRLAGYKRPREIVFLAPEEMPRNATGKILHRELRDLLAKRRAANNANQE
jgi:acyl-CoA synthetase (AMP-forming)/AMP-acid ligase II